ncbi:MAG TPA: DNA alkylation response protein, partial [Bradyrhizobium sp.]
RAHKALQAELTRLLDDAAAIPASFRDRLRQTLDRSISFAERVATEPALEDNARAAASSLYHVTSAILMAWESAQPDADARRALYARSILDHRLGVQDPLQPSNSQLERAAADILLSDRQVSFAEIAGLLDQ